MIYPNIPDENEPRISWWEVAMGALFGLLICSLLSGCKTQYVDRIVTDTLIVANHDTVYQQRVVRDSISIHDSIYFEVKEKGDTVFAYKYVEHVAWKDRVKHDSVYLTRVDTVTNNYTHIETVEKEVEKKLTEWQRFSMWLGRFVFFSLLIGGILYGVYRYLSWKNIIK